MNSALLIMVAVWRTKAAAIVAQANKPRSILCFLGLDCNRWLGIYSTPMRTTRRGFIDLCCGIGGFRIAAEQLGWKCVFSSDIDEECRRAYKANFGEEPRGDLAKIDSVDIPRHEVLFAGFPCQMFSPLTEPEEEREGLTRTTLRCS
ncbi:MAG: DNA cytosine methyltransferase [Terriglobia bacterium]